jgi:hypothetical protein
MEKILSDEELTALLVSLGKGMGKFTTEDAMTVGKWAEDIILNYEILQGVLYNDNIVILVQDGEVLMQYKEN